MNWIVALSNFPCLYPLWRAKGDWWTFATISFVSIASFISHLAENHKHNMPGALDVSKQCSYFLNRLDEFGCVLTIARFSQLYYYKYGLYHQGVVEHPFLVLSALFAFICLKISAFLDGKPYVVMHSVWHIAIMIIMGHYLQIIYN